MNVRLYILPFQSHLKNHNLSLREKLDNHFSLQKDIRFLKQSFQRNKKFAYPLNNSDKL